MGRRYLDFNSDQDEGHFDRKFTHADVINYPELIDAAEEWLRKYQGSYPFLVQSKECLYRKGRLDRTVIKGVLNCIRHDCKSEELVQKMYHLRRRQPEPVRIVKPRPPFITIRNFKINKAFGYSQFKTSKYVHVINKDRCDVTYYNHVDEWRIRIKFFCSSDAGASKHLRITNEPPLDFLICRTCRTMCQDDPDAKRALEEVDEYRARFTGTVAQGLGRLLRAPGGRRSTDGEDEKLSVSGRHGPGEDPAGAGSVLY